MLIPILLSALIVASFWFIFEKAGRYGWRSLIPFYNIYTEYEIAWNTSKFWRTLIAGGAFYLCLIVVVFAEMADKEFLMFMALFAAIGFLVWFVILSCKFWIRLARAFGRSDGFGWGLIFLPPIFLAILAFDDSEYYGPQND